MIREKQLDPPPRGLDEAVLEEGEGPFRARRRAGGQLREAVRIGDDEVLADELPPVLVGGNRLGRGGADGGEEEGDRE